MNMIFATMLKNARLAVNATQQQAADVLKVKKNTISNYENGISSPDMDSLAILCDFYRIDMGAVLNSSYGTNKSTVVNLSFSPSEISMIKAYRHASDDDRAVVEAALRKYMAKDSTMGDDAKMA